MSFLRGHCLDNPLISPLFHRSLLFAQLLLIYVSFFSHGSSHRFVYYQADVFDRKTCRAAKSAVTEGMDVKHMKGSLE
jgi:hypothetical protein